MILNIHKPENYHHEIWPKCSFFGIYDGHGGATCADFLRENLHNYVKNKIHYKKVFSNKNFPHNIEQAILNGFAKAEADFVNNYATNIKGDITDNSGSCAITLFIIGKKRKFI